VSSSIPCHVCGQTSGAKGTTCYRLHKAKELIVIVVTLLAHGCPVQAVVSCQLPVVSCATDRWLRTTDHGLRTSAHRDGELITALVQKVKACALCRALLFCVDRFTAYIGTIQAVLRVPVPTGKAGRPQPGGAHDHG
jgi:hypothetical protein